LFNYFKKPAVFLDRDGVINHDYGYVHTINKFKFRNGVIKGLKYLSKKKYYIFVVTNQAGIAKKKFNQIDIVVNNAGVTKDAMIHKMTDKEWNYVIDIHAKGCFNICRAVAPYVRYKNHNGSIINVSSISAQKGNIGQANYSAAKAAIMGLTRSIANEWACFGIRCNTVSYGFIDTRLTRVKEINAINDKLSNDFGMPAAARKTALAHIPLGFAATTQMAAAPVLFLASDDANYITGQILNVNGGAYM